MTSKISFFKLVRAEIRRMSWLADVQMLVFTLFFPFRVLMAMAIRQNEKLRYGSATYSAVVQFCRNAGLERPENTCLILAAGALCALSAFAYVHSPVKQDFYHSLSLKREELFGIKYLSSALTFVMPYLISQVLVVLVGLIYQAVTPQIALEVAVTGIQGILFFLCSYSSVLVAIMLTGNFLTTMLAVGAFGLYLALMVALGKYFKVVFMETSVETLPSSERTWISWTSPWAWCLFSESDGSAGMTGTLPSVGNLCQLIAIAAALTLIALALYRVRRTEAGGLALTFYCAEPIVKIMMAIPASLVAGLIAYEIFESVAFELLFILLSGALVCVVIEFIYRVDIRQVLSNKWQFAAAALLSCAIFFFFRFDLSGYNTWLPVKNDVASMSVSDYGTSYCVVITEDGRAEYLSVRSRLDSIEWEDFERIYELAQNGVENVKKYKSSYAVYDEEITYVYLKYHLKNGKEVYRGYEINRSLFCEVMDELLQDEAFREQYYPICAWDDTYMDKIAQINCWFYGMDAETLFTTAEKTDADESVYEDVVYNGDFNEMIPLSRLSDLVEAYCEDLKTISFEDFLSVYGQIYFLYDKDYINDYYPFSEKFTNTVELLKEIYYQGNS
ncbi:MAG: DUF6449 domain-containing protein [Lachnospiraceae bacterium]|nr:DUF6449 domain-containing protein [Lachnospiraceae bacterium]